MLDRWRRHPRFAGVAASPTDCRAESTVLRGRPGYRQVTRFFVDLQARTRLLDPTDAEQLLEVRDAALIYEYWCYFQVVEAVGTRPWPRNRRPAVPIRELWLQPRPRPTPLTSAPPVSSSTSISEPALAPTRFRCDPTSP